MKKALLVLLSLLLICSISLAEDAVSSATLSVDRLAVKAENNSSAEALIRLLGTGDITITMHDYGSFEKVGPLGTTIPRNDEDITTTPGDIILYQGNQITIYYDENRWDFTKLGHIDIGQDELKAVLGSGDVTVTLSVNP